MKPALAAFRLGPGIPGIGQHLQAPIGELDQILLKRIHPECVLDSELGFLSVLAFRGYKETAVFAVEARPGAEMRGCASLKSPSTAASVASCMACACCEAFQAFPCPSWHPMQTAEPTKSEGRAAYLRSESRADKAARSHRRAENGKRQDRPGARSQRPAPFLIRLPHPRYPAES